MPYCAVPPCSTQLPWGVFGNLWALVGVAKVSCVTLPGAGWRSLPHRSPVACSALAGGIRGGARRAVVPCWTLCRTRWANFASGRPIPATWARPTCCRRRCANSCAVPAGGAVRACGLHRIQVGACGARIEEREDICGSSKGAGSARSIVADRNRHEKLCLIVQPTVSQTSAWRHGAGNGACRE